MKKIEDIIPDVQEMREELLKHCITLNAAAADDMATRAEFNRTSRMISLLLEVEDVALNQK